MSVFSEDQVTPATQSEQVSAFEEPTGLFNSPGLNPSDHVT